MSIDATVGLIGDVFTAAAAVAAVVALVYARRTVVVAHAAEKEADTAAKEAAADRRRAANQAAAEGEDVMVEEDHDALYRQTYWNCQPCSYPNGTGDLRSIVEPADFYSSRQWHSTGMYCDMYRPQHYDFRPVKNNPLRLVMKISTLQKALLVFAHGLGGHPFGH